MNVAKVGAGRGEYYLSQVAEGAEDYYSERGEAPGEWLGAGVEALGLAGEVVGHDLRAVLEGRSPAGDPLGRQRTTPGFDVTFRAPKGVSLLFALADPDISEQVREGHTEAVRQTVAYLERVACFTRRGPQGRETIRGHGLVAAGFLHRTSRAGDPQLHTHVLIANAVQGIDGRWSSLDGRYLFSQVRTAGLLYQAALRAQLTQRLGVDWLPARHGLSDVAGIDRRVIEEFSQRRRQILAVLAERGESSERAAQVATLATRPAKPDGDFATLRRGWQERAAGLGFGAEMITKMIDRIPPATPTAVPSCSAAELVGPGGLTGRRSSFTRNDVLQAWCEHLPHGAPVAAVEVLADDVLDSALVTTLSGSAAEAVWRRSYERADGTSMPSPPFGAARYTTPEMEQAERGLVDSAVDRQRAEVGVAVPSIVDAAISLRPMLSLEQQHAVLALTSSGNGVEVVVGKAGAGKTTVLDTARAAWQVSGQLVIGCALSARAAAKLQDTAGIPSATIHRLTSELEQVPLPHGAVVVVDEAAMVGTRTLNHLSHLVAAADGKLVLVGDDRQLAAIDAGGGFRALTQALTPITLTENRRQQHAWERHALDRLRDGHVDAALDALRNHGRVTIATTSHDARQAMVHDWHQARRHGIDAPMLALHRTDVDDLNLRARAWLIAAGELSGDHLDIGGRSFAVGDSVVGKRNDYRTGILNGTRGTVTAIHPDEQTVTIQPNGSDQQLRLPRSYLARGHLDHAYALTVHKAQGATWDEAFVLGSDRLHREAGYVALTRARQATWLYTVGTQPDEHATHELDPDHLAPLRHALRRSHAEPSIRELHPEPTRGRSAGASPI